MLDNRGGYGRIAVVSAAFAGYTTNVCVSPAFRRDLRYSRGWGLGTGGWFGNWRLGDFIERELWGLGGVGDSVQDTRDWGSCLLCTVVFPVY